MPLVHIFFIMQANVTNVHASISAQTEGDTGYDYNDAYDDDFDDDAGNMDHIDIDNNLLHQIL